MLTLSIVWVVLAATVTMLATMRKRAASPNDSDSHAPESGRAMTVFAVVYGLVLLAGFLYVGWKHGLELIQ